MPVTEHTPERASDNDNFSTSTGAPEVAHASEVIGPDVEIESPAAVALPAPRNPNWSRARTVAALVSGLVLVALSLLAATLIVPLRLLAFTVGAVLLFNVTSAAVRRRRPHARPGLWVAIAWLGGIALLSLFASVLPIAEGRDPSLTLAEPSLASPQLLSSHPLGTDTLGLDILAQLIFGARVSLTVAFGASLLALITGTTVGMLAGYLGGIFDQVIGFVTDVLLSFPALILLLAMVTFLSANLTNVTLALGVLAFPGYVRLARASTLTIASREFVVASRTLGAGPMRIMFRNLLPNIIGGLIAYSFIVMSFLIVAEASLSYLGLGIQRPNPTWGNLIAQGQTRLQTEPFLVAIPAVALFLTVTSANFIGQSLQAKR